MHDISQSGAYICTPERWYLGTIIRLILQGHPAAMREDGAAVPTASICIPARVVRHGSDGVAVEFVFRNHQEEERSVGRSWLPFQLNRRIVRPARGRCVRKVRPWSSSPC